MANPIIVDGSQGEGGGQILRTSLALAAILGQEVEIRTIRANRPRPGLRPQHLATARALAVITGGRLEGDFENATSLIFKPGKIQGGRHHFKIGTAGSITLMLAALLPPLLLAEGPSRLTIEGGTHVPFSPPFHYFSQIFLPVLRRLGCKVSATLNRWGWYPAGGGEVTLEIHPCRRLQSLKLPEQGVCRHLELLIGLSNNLPPHIARQEQDVVSQLVGSDIEILSTLQQPHSRGEGNMVFLKAFYPEITVGFSALGRKGLPSGQVAAAVCEEWLAFKQSKASIEHYLADQIVLYLALAQGDSLFFTKPFSSHLLTNLTIIEQFLPVCFRKNTKNGLLTVTGIDFFGKRGKK